MPGSRVFFARVTATYMSMRSASGGKLALLARELEVAADLDRIPLKALGLVSGGDNHVVVLGGGGLHVHQLVEDREQLLSAVVLHQLDADAEVGAVLGASVGHRVAPGLEGPKLAVSAEALAGLLDLHELGGGADEADQVLGAARDGDALASGLRMSMAYSMTRPAFVRQRIASASTAADGRVSLAGLPTTLTGASSIVQEAVGELSDGLAEAEALVSVSSRRPGA
jgi:hypothetical protein